MLEITGMNQDTREGFDACCWLLAEFCRWGELRRRHLGETPRDMLTVAALQLAPPAELPRMRVTVMEAVAAGFRRDIPDEEAEAKERDLILEELDGAQKKNASGGELRTQYLAIAAKVFRVPVREALLLTIGEHQDMLAFLANAQKKTEEG